MNFYAMKGKPSQIYPKMMEAESKEEEQFTRLRGCSFPGLSCDTQKKGSVVLLLSLSPSYSHKVFPIALNLPSLVCSSHTQAL